MEKQENARGFTRLSIPVKIEVKTNVNSAFAGTVQNLSINGVLITGDKKLPIGTVCETRIILEDQKPLVIVTHGEVVRSDVNGIAITFSSIEEDGFTHLKNLLLYNSLEPNKLEDEMSIV